MAASYLLRLLALHRRHYRYSSICDHISGILNRMADDASRLWKFTDKKFLSHMNLTYPQNYCWRLCSLRPQLNSALNLALSKIRLDTESFLLAIHPTHRSGTRGSISQRPLDSMRYFQPFRTASPSSTFLSLEFGAGTSPMTEPRFEHILLRHTSGRLVRRTPGWGPTTPGSLRTVI